MKLLSKLAKEYLPKSQEGRLIHAIQDAFVLKHLDSPIMSNEARCPMCGGTNGMTCAVDPVRTKDNMWFCLEDDCRAMIDRSYPKGDQWTPKSKRSVEWPLFCEMNDMGDLVHDVAFEKIEQSSAKIEYLLKFAKAPKGIILMEGDTGTGKTYASMALCELFTRTNSSCMFFTGDGLSKKWQDTFKSERPSGLIQKLKEVNLLVVDDFGTGEPSPGFMQFFMELINTRLQWSNRGTVISTNLDDKRLGKFCGEALTDRLNTGQKFVFKDKSRRKQTVL